MTTLVLFAALALADVPSASPPQSPEPRAEGAAPAVPTWEDVNLRLLKQRADELKRQTAVADARYRFVKRLLGGVEARWADPIIGVAMKGVYQASTAQLAASHAYEDAWQAESDRRRVQRRLINKVYEQHIAMYDAYATFRGLWTIAAHWIDPFLGQGRSILPVPEMPALSPVPPEPSPLPE